MENNHNLLVVEDDEADYSLLETRLNRDGLACHCHQVTNRQELVDALALDSWDIVLVDYRVPGLPFEEVLSHVHGHDADLPIIVVSGTIGEEAAVDLLKQGVVDFVLKDRLARLVPAIQRVMRDIEILRERREAEKSLERHSRALMMLSKGNHTLLHCTEENQLLHAMCEAAVDTGGYRMAWVGYKVDDAAQSVRLMATAGTGQEYLKQADISWGAGRRGHGPAGLAIRNADTQVLVNMTLHPSMKPWQAAALEWGFNSLIALPLKDKTGAFGVFAIYTEQTDAFDFMEVPLLEEMAEDLSFGIVTLRNNIAHQKAESELKSSYSLLETTLESTVDGIAVFSLSGAIVRFNRKFSEIFNIAPEVLQSASYDELTEHVSALVENRADFFRHSHELRQAHEVAYRDEIEMKDGRIIERIRQPHYMDGQVIGHVSTLRDISERRHHEQQLVYLANHDELTDLPNRNLLNDRLRQAIAYCARSEQLIALLFLDLDRFKLVNDSLGHEFGDKVLIETTKRLSHSIREGDTVARIGGDKFVILLPGLQHEDDVEGIALKLLDAIAKPFMIDGRELLLEACIGAALYPRDGDEAAILFKHADAAMYRAKAHGGHTLRYYLENIDTEIERHLHIATQLQYAIERKQLEVYYQPQFDIEAGIITGAEALIRWRHPELGMVSPAEFIPIAEESSVILRIGEWLADAIFADCSRWWSEGLQTLSAVSMNISARQFDNVTLPTILATLLNKYGLDPAKFTLELELTEGMLMRYPEQAIKTLHELKAMNFAISIDDFGTGYSSLVYLKRFPIDKLKIDKAFVQGIPDDNEDITIVRAVIVMAHELGLKVVAEGVETEAQFAFLKQHQCDYSQGYFTGRPMPVKDFEALLRKQ
ncbi:EAL domain-containing protein [Methylophaga sp. OBS4]|uniref:EAL domain-containing protein n=1 Tax=Methylophaga sp. OBS4 TaxID=2991935 RepID=UPI0022562350|nr:EAL domain-containing protein [Methylophaga sp. OBS4]MCX4187145.1 EAL domain-containing protein [Methylophaga sp. OBS4]